MEMTVFFFFTVISMKPYCQVLDENNYYFEIPIHHKSWLQAVYVSFPEGMDYKIGARIQKNSSTIIPAISQDSNIWFTGNCQEVPFEFDFNDLEDSDIFQKGDILRLEINTHGYYDSSPTEYYNVRINFRVILKAVK